RHNSRFVLPERASSVTYTLSLHDALPISEATLACAGFHWVITKAGSTAVRWITPARVRVAAISGEPQATQRIAGQEPVFGWRLKDRKSTRLNSSHVKISYAAFCLQKKTRT